MKLKIKYLLIYSFTTLTNVLYGQKNDTSPISNFELKEVTISASRLPTNSEGVPISITKLDSVLINLSTQNLSVKEYLQHVPGVYIQNANNFAQDARISIRGFGATAAFGIRGIKLVVDGIPETTPDGTGQLDNLNLDLINKMEIIRGNASSLYGNASGGVILVQSNFDFTKNFLKSHSSAGSFGFHSQAFTGGIKTEKTTYTAHFRTFGNNGFRDNSKFKQTNSRLAIRHQFSNRMSAILLAEFVDSPIAKDAGGLTLDETEEDFRQARDRNLTFQAGESITQGKLGASLKWNWSANKLVNSYIFYNQRTFDGKLPFEDGGIINLSRNYVGIGNSIDLKVKTHSIKIGYDLLSQKDQRKRFDNLEGEKGDLGLQQDESFLNFGWFLLDYIEMDRWYFSAGIRQDMNRLSTSDHFLTNGDDSGEIDINNWSYHFGVGFKMTSSWQLYANHSTNFETPTLNQLSNRPDNSGGFENLKSATASSFETGIKWVKSRLKGELVGFIINTKNELVPYELAEFPERTFYQNAGSTLRQGLEFSLSYVSDFWRIHTSYTFSDFNYNSFEQNGERYDGLALPGVPSHYGALNLVTTPSQYWELTLPITYTGKMDANSKNNIQTDGFLLVSLTARYKTQLKRLAIEPYFGVRNLTNQAYFDNIRINAFGGRYYEPAPERNFYIGLTMKL